MRRAPFVVVATGAGLGLVLSYHTHPLSTKTVRVAGPAGTTSTTPTTAGRSGSPTTGSATSSTTTPASSALRSATGEDVTYRYGDLQLQVTEQGSKLESIQIVSDGASDPRSEQINSQALPQLQQEALSAQSANIDGVSGATFTSQAFAAALQSALNELK